MTVRSVVLVLLSILAAIFLILNWQGIVAPVPVNFIFGQIEAPLGLILLVVLGVLWIVGIAWSLMTQASTLLEIRRAYKEANANKSLANHAELSRTEQMKKTLQEEMNRMQTQLVAELKASTQTSAAAASHNDERLAALESLHRYGCRTWVSIEPYPTPNIIEQDLIELLNRISFADRIIFGRTNYNKQVSNYKPHREFYNSCAIQVKEFCSMHGISCHIKSGTQT